MSPIQMICEMALFFIIGLAIGYVVRFAVSVVFYWLEDR